MKVTVCELANDPTGFSDDWEALVRHVKKERSELVLLPEMPFYPWPFVTKDFDKKTWEESMSAHDGWVRRLGELSATAVLGTRPVASGTKRLNQGFVWGSKSGYKGVHEKYYLPDEKGFWEASWYSRGDGSFVSFAAAGAKLGLLICSEMWSMADASRYGRSGAHIIATPRATEKATVDKWLAGGRTCAVVSGCFSLSSNRMSRTDGTGNLGGLSWVVDPDGKVLGTTSKENPFLSVDIRLEDAIAAKKTYPRDSLFAS